MTLHLAHPGPSAMNIIHVEHLSKTFRTDWGRKAVALRDVSLDVREGEIFGLLGPNGAGKTTTFGILLGFQRPTGGTGTLFGHPLGSVEARRRVGFLSENPYFYDHLSARELVDTFCRLYGHSLSGSQIDELLERVGLNPRDRKPLRKYSKGMRQRVGLAQAVMHKPDLVILDEPMSGLDPTGRREFRDIIAGLKKHGSTVLLASHVLSDVEALCDRVGFLIDGRLRKVGTVDELVHTASGAFEIIGAGLPSDLILELGGECEVRHSGNCVVVAAPTHAAAQTVIQRIFNRNGQVLAMRPQAGSLEDVFVQYLNQDARDDAEAAKTTEAA